MSILHRTSSKSAPPKLSCQPETPLLFSCLRQRPAFVLFFSSYIPHLVDFWKSSWPNLRNSLPFSSHPCTSMPINREHQPPKGPPSSHLGHTDTLGSQVMSPSGPNPFEGFSKHTHTHQNSKFFGSPASPNSSWLRSHYFLELVWVTPLQPRQACSCLRRFIHRLLPITQSLTA